MEQQQVNERQSSIELTRNSKGYTWSAKVYYDETKRNPAEVLKTLEEINNSLKAKYGSAEQ